MIARLLLATALCTGVCTAQRLDGITHAALRVPQLDRSVAFYRNLGFEQAFTFEDDGKISVAFMKVNDHQFVELYPGGAPELMHICYETSVIQAVHDEYGARGIAVSEVRKARAGNLLFSFKDPEDKVVEYLQYLPGSLHVEDRGKHLGARRIADRIVRVGVPARDRAAQQAYYTGKLGLGREVEPVSGPPVITFAVDDAAATERELQKRGLKPKRSGTTVSVTDPDGNAIAFAARAPWTAVADRLVTTPAAGYAFNWGEGVQMMGLMRAAALTHNPRYSAFVDAWLRHHEASPLETLLSTGAAPPNRARPGYCGYWSPGSAALYLHEAKPAPEHLRLARDIAGFIGKGAERSPEGALGHWQGSHQLWVDTLYMACPLLAGLGRLEKRPELIADAARQIELYAKHLQDEQSGLFYHMWDWQTGTHTEGLWGRGNGWVIMSIADTLETMRPSVPGYASLSAIARKQWVGLAAKQDVSGLWHTVMEDPASYPECSATAMVVYGVLKLIRLGVLPATARPPVMKAWREINDRFVLDGIVAGVSAGTDPHGVEAYRKKAVGSETWGTGAYLLAASEVARR
jgi:rhamnogalacturonyl hydrolase YesR/catechol 2,3-dioxygenase-like lactoylglutathione lyase family enzyme